MAKKQTAKKVKPLKVPVVLVETFDGDALTRTAAYRHWLGKHHDAIQAKDIVILARLYTAHEMTVEYTDVNYHPDKPEPTQLPA